MRIIFLLFLVISSVHSGVWIPGPIRVDPQGVAFLSVSYPNPMNMALNPNEANQSGFFSTFDGNDFDFKRVLAIPGVDSDSNLMEYAPLLFLPGDNKDGYFVVENSKKMLKVKLDGVVGIQPGFFSIRFVPTFSNISELKDPDKIPLNPSDFSNWSAGDVLTFRKSSDLLVNYAFGAKTFLDYGVSASISSTWDIQISRLNYPGKVLMIKVNIKKGKDAPYWVYKGNYSEEVNLYKLWGKSNEFTYEFDLTNQNISPPLKILSYTREGTIEKKVENANSLMAYQEALKGNLIIANLLSQKKIFGVKKIFEEDEEIKIKTQPISKRLGITWKFDSNFKKGIPQIVGKLKSFPGDLLLENVVGIYFPENKNKIFAGFLQQISHLDEDSRRVERRFGASLKTVHFFKEIDRVQLRGELEHAVFRGGFSNTPLFPEITVDKILGLKLTMDFQFSNLAVDLLLNLPEEYPFSALINEANDSIGQHFKRFVGIDQELCRDYLEKNLTQCIFNTRKRTYQAMTDGYKALSKMKQLRNAGNYMEFFKGFSEFGKAFVENRFVIGTFIKFMGWQYDPSLKRDQRFTNPRTVKENNKEIKVPYFLHMEIVGENIPKLQKTIRSDQ
jgi:hypothetical protein